MLFAAPRTLRGAALFVDPAGLPPEPNLAPSEMNRSIPPGPLAAVLLLASLPLVGRADAQSLRGSQASVELMYSEALTHDLHFYQTPEGIRRAAARGEFVRLPGNADYEIVRVSHPYVLPITRTFVHRLAAQYRQACGEQLVVTSAMRPQSMRLLNGTDRSVHPTGMALDLRKPTNARCLAWLREVLAFLDARGVVEATEERRPPHFHVAVFPRQYSAYLRGESPPSRLASAQRTHTVRRGDSLWSIARQSRTTVEALKMANGLRSSRILAGQVLVIPAAESADQR